MDKMYVIVFSCLVVGIMAGAKLTINNVEFYNEINYAYPSEGENMEVVYTLDKVISRVVVSRFLYDDSSVLIFDTKKKVTNFKVDNQDIVFNNASNTLKVTINGFKIENNGTYQLSVFYAKNDDVFANYFVLNYRRYVSLKPFTISRNEDPKVKNINKGNLNIDASKSTLAGLVYTVYGLNENHKIHVYINNYEHTTLFASIAHHKTEGSSYYQKTMLYYIQDSFRLSECVLHQKNTNFRIGVSDYLGLKEDIDILYSFNLKTVGGFSDPNTCSVSPTVKFNGIYQRDVLRCVHYMRAEYLYSNEDGEVSINFYIRENQEWVGIGYFQKKNRQIKKVVKELGDILHGQFWTDFVFPEGTDTQNHRFKCVVHHNQKRILGTTLKSIHIEGDGKDIDRTKKSEQLSIMDDIKDRLTLGAMKENSMFLPLVYIPIIIGVLFVLLKKSKKPSGKSAAQTFNDSYASGLSTEAKMDTSRYEYSKQ